MLGLGLVEVSSMPLVDDGVAQTSHGWSLRLETSKKLMDTVNTISLRQGANKVTVTVWLPTPAKDSIEWMYQHTHITAKKYLGHRKAFQ
jgi:hypothetical protein